MLDKTYNPSEIEPRLYEGWERAGAFACRSELQCDALHDHDPAAERHRQPAHGPCADLHRAGHADPLAPHAGPRRAVAAGHRSRRHRHADGGGAAAGGAGDGSARAGAARSSSSASGSGRRNPAARSRSSCAGSGASLDWPRERFTMDDGLSAAVRKVFVDAVPRGADLPRPAAGELGPEAADGDLRPRGGEPRGEGFALAHPLSDRGRARPVHHRRDDAAGDDAGRHGRGGASRGSRGTASWSASTRSCRWSGAVCRSWPTTTRTRRRAPAR